MGVGFFTPFPKYLQIRDLLVRRLGSDYSPGDRFPTEQALTDEFGVSRETVREALSGLEKDGILRRHRGRGTFVARLPANRPDERLTGPVEGFTELKLNTEARILKSGVCNLPPAFFSRHGIPAGQPFYLIRRLRLLDGAPLAQHDAYMPVEVGVRINRLDLRHTTIMGELRDTLGIPIREQWQQIDATVADTELAEPLNVSIGAPLLSIRRLFHDDAGEPVVLFISHFRADRYFYTVGVEFEGADARQKKLRPPRKGRRRSRR